MCAEKKPASASGKEGFEAELKQLEQLVESLRVRRRVLDALVAKYEEGMRLLKSCQKSLEAAELRIEQLGKRGEDSQGSMSLLASIRGPADVKALAPGQLPLLAQEIR
jgi:exodeoxyribonuclease VII small subunit